MAGCVDRLISAIETGTRPGADVFSEDATLDATVPNWRLWAHGSDAVADQLAGWYMSPGRFEELERIAIPGGELVEFFLTWDEDGVPMGAHQQHRLRVVADRVAEDVVFCGGRWPAGLLAEIGEAAGHGG